MSKLLLFSLLAFCTVAALAHATDSRVAPSAGQSMDAPDNPFAAMPQGLSPSTGDQANVSKQDRTCLRIHAFIFKTDDDRVPQLVRETTCMSAAKLALKKVNNNQQPRLVLPGGHSL